MKPIEEENLTLLLVFHNNKKKSIIVSLDEVRLKVLIDRNYNVVYANR